VHAAVSVKYPDGGQNIGCVCVDTPYPHPSLLGFTVIASYFLHCMSTCSDSLDYR